MCSLNQKLDAGKFRNFSVPVYATSCVRFTSMFSLVKIDCGAFVSFRLWSCSGSILASWYTN